MLPDGLQKSISNWRKSKFLKFWYHLGSILVYWVTLSKFTRFVFSSVTWDTSSHLTICVKYLVGAKYLLLSLHCLSWSHLCFPPTPSLGPVPPNCVYSTLCQCILPTASSVLTHTCPPPSCEPFYNLECFLISGGKEGLLRSDLVVLCSFNSLFSCSFSCSHVGYFSIPRICHPIFFL